MQKYFLAGIGGFLGAAARLWVGAYFDSLGARFPYGTFVVNLSGCLVLGIALAILNEKLNVDPAWRYLLAIGFIGSYTTFSTFEYEALTGFQSGAWALSALYAIASVLLGFAAVWAGTVIGRWIG